MLKHSSIPSQPPGPEMHFSSSFLGIIQLFSGWGHWVFPQTWLQSWDVQESQHLDKPTVAATSFHVLFLSCRALSYHEWSCPSFSLKGRELPVTSYLLWRKRIFRDFYSTTLWWPPGNWRLQLQRNPTNQASLKHSKTRQTHQHLLKSSALHLLKKPSGFSHLISWDQRFLPLGILAMQFLHCFL